MSSLAIASKLPAGLAVAASVATAVAVTPVRLVWALTAAATSLALLLAAAPMATPFNRKPPAAKAVLPRVLPMLCATTPSASSWVGFKEATCPVSIAAKSAVCMAATWVVVKPRATWAVVRPAACAVVKATT